MSEIKCPAHPLAYEIFESKGYILFLRLQNLGECLAHIECIITIFSENIYQSTNLETQYKQLLYSSTWICTRKLKLLKQNDNWSSHIQHLALQRLIELNWNN